MKNYATQKELEDVAGVDTSNLAVKRDFIALKAEVEKQDFNKLVTVPIASNKLKPKVDDLDVDTLKSVPTIFFKKMIDVLRKEVIEKTKYAKLNSKINNLKNKNPDASTLAYMNQYNTDKQGLENKIENVDKKTQGVSSLVTNTNFNTKISEVENRYQMLVI